MAIDGAEATLRIASALASAGRVLDLAGLDVEIGKLCASLLDLPPDHGRALRPRLIGIAVEMDRLAATLVPP